VEGRGWDGKGNGVEGITKTKTLYDQIGSWQVAVIIN
jgi:hypothetical protein